jgi:hypothetical protein
MDNTNQGSEITSNWNVKCNDDYKGYQMRLGDYICHEE